MTKAEAVVRADVSQDFVPVGQLGPEHRVRQWRGDNPLDVDRVVLRHTLTMRTLLREREDFGLTPVADSDRMFEMTA